MKSVICPRGIPGCFYEYHLDDHRGGSVSAAVLVDALEGSPGKAIARMENRVPLPSTMPR